MEEIAMKTSRMIVLGSPVIAAGLTFALSLPGTPFAEEQSAAPPLRASVDYRVRASELIGKPAANGAQERIGKVDDILIDRRGNAIYAVLAVARNQGIGAKLVAVPYDRLKAPNNEAVIYDAPVDQLLAQPEFRYREIVVSFEPDQGRDEYLKGAGTRMSEWDRRLGELRHAAQDKSKQAARTLDDAWAEAKQRWSKLKEASADGWDHARSNLERAWNDLERSWKDVTS